MNFLDLSGYMFSGKSAVSDFIREHRGFNVPNYRSEFDLIRVPHGLLDLKHALVDDWSWVRSDKAIREFVQMTLVMNRRPRTVYEKLFKPGFSYSESYENFLEKTTKFVDSITDDTWAMSWPYELTSIGPLQHAYLKIKSKLKGAHAWPEIKYHLASGNEFMYQARNYLQDLLTTQQERLKYHTTVTHNMLEPYNPTSGFCFFEKIKSIVIDRDVRDIYMTAITYSKGLNDIVPLYSRIIGAFDIDVFIKRQKIMRERTDYSANSDILRVNYEDLVLDYDESSKFIRAFLGISDHDHVEKMKFFNPEISIKNIGLWKKAKNNEMKKIQRLERELPELCYS